MIKKNVDESANDYLQEIKTDLTIDSGIFIQTLKQEDDQATEVRKKNNKFIKELQKILALLDKRFPAEKPLTPGKNGDYPTYPGKDWE